VTIALFAPFGKRKTKYGEEGQIIVTGDSSGDIKVFENRLLNATDTNGNGNTTNNNNNNGEIVGGEKKSQHKRTMSTDF
jgi:hypothetical protein